MEIAVELLVALGSAISGLIGALITARRRKAQSKKAKASTSVVEVRVVGGQESGSARFHLPADEANRLLREARQASSAESSSSDTGT